MAVPITSAVSVLVIDCTTIGASPPTQTLRSPCWTSTRRLARRAIGPEGIGRFVEVIRCSSIVRSERRLVPASWSAYFIVTREIVLPGTGGSATAAPRSVAVTAAGLPTTRVAVPGTSTVSVLPARTRREISALAALRLDFDPRIFAHVQHQGVGAGGSRRSGTALQRLPPAWQCRRVVAAAVAAAGAAGVVRRRWRRVGVGIGRRRHRNQRHGRVMHRIVGRRGGARSSFRPARSRRRRSSPRSRCRAS